LGRTVEELQQSMSSAEFSEWQARHQIDPIGSERDDYRFTMMALLIAELVTGKRPEFDKVYRIFRPFDAPKQPQPKQSLDQMLAFGKRFFNRYTEKRKEQQEANK